jgi:exonuclease SbcC
MRPRRLELEGFTAFKDTTVISFEDLDLFAITGPTGAGKSSLIDAKR